MIELGLEGLVSDAGLFVYRDKHSFVIAVIYVDDAIFCRPNKALVKQLKDRFMQRWECWDLGDMTEFLRMRIIKEGSTVNIDQCTYLDTIWNGVGCKTQSLPQPLSWPGTCLRQQLRMQP